MRKCHRCSEEISCRQKIMMWLLYLLYFLVYPLSNNNIFKNYYLVTQIGRGCASVLTHTPPMAVPSVLQEWEQIFQSLSKEEALHLIAVFLSLRVLCYVVYWTVAVLQFCVSLKWLEQKGIPWSLVLVRYVCHCIYTEEDRERGRERKEEKDGVILVLHQMTKNILVLHQMTKKFM